LIKVTLPPTRIITINIDEDSLRTLKALLGRIAGPYYKSGGLWTLDASFQGEKTANRIRTLVDTFYQELETAGIKAID
jgi:hypothetical protein